MECRILVRKPLENTLEIPSNCGNKNFCYNIITGFPSSSIFYLESKRPLKDDKLITVADWRRRRWSSEHRQVRYQNSMKSPFSYRLYLSLASLAILPPVPSKYFERDPREPNSYSTLKSPIYINPNVSIKNTFLSILICWHFPIENWSLSMVCAMKNLTTLWIDSRQYISCQSHLVDTTILPIFQMFTLVFFTRIRQMLGTNKWSQRENSERIVKYRFTIPNETQTRHENGVLTHIQHASILG